MKIKNKAYTLSEVLIALVVIGVIAAITIPAIITSTNNHEHKTAYKKAYSDLSNAVLQGIAFGEFPLREKNLIPPHQQRNGRELKVSLEYLNYVRIIMPLTVGVMMKDGVSDAALQV